MTAITKGVSNMTNDKNYDNMDPETFRSYGRQIYGHEIWLGDIGRDDVLRKLRMRPRRRSEGCFDAFLKHRPCGQRPA